MSKGATQATRGHTQHCSLKDPSEVVEAADKDRG